MAGRFRYHPVPRDGGVASSNLMFSLALGRNCNTSPLPSERVHVGTWYICGLQRRSHVMSFGPAYVLPWYLTLWTLWACIQVPRREIFYWGHLGLSRTSRILPILGVQVSQIQDGVPNGSPTGSTRNDILPVFRRSSAKEICYILGVGWIPGRVTDAC